MKKLIAIVGMAGSGKSVATDYLEKKGYQKIYFGGLIYRLMQERNIEITPDSQKEFREELRRKEGMGVVAKILLPEIKKAYENGDTVLDGLYSWDEYLILKEEFGSRLKLVSICCDKKIRYDRLAKRKDRPFQEEEAIKRDIAEIENSAKGGPIAFADYYLFNNSSLEEYYHRLEEIIHEMEEEGEM